jgi:PAS domain S-box-containing protein
MPEGSADVVEFGKSIANAAVAPGEPFKWQTILMLAADVYKLLEGTADAAFVTTQQGEICSWNAAAERLFGYKPAEVLTKTCHEIFQGKGALGDFVCSGECSVQHCVINGQSSPAFDLEVTTDRGKRIWVSVSIIVFEDSRVHRRLIAHLAHDISSRKELEQAFSAMIEASKQLISIGNGDGVARHAPIESLSEQEQRILKLFAMAKNSTQVAKELAITLPTLRNHLHAINQKLRTHNRLEAVLHAMKRGVI